MSSLVLGAEVGHGPAAWSRCSSPGVVLPWPRCLAPLRERLNAIRIPLRETDADVALDLQALVDQAYRRGRYDQELDYRQPPHPPLNADDAVWADELLRSRGAP